MTELSPAARAVLGAAAVSACLTEWGPVNDPPCHPDDEGWNGCHLCVKCGLIAAALRAAADQILPSRSDWHESFMLLVDELEAQQSTSLPLCPTSNKSALN